MKLTSTKPLSWFDSTKMTSTSLSDILQLSQLGPSWPGVKVAVTQSGFHTGSSSLSPYGFNLGTHVGDRLESVENRRAALQAHMGAPIVWLNQVHGCAVHFARPLADACVPNADASVCIDPQACLAIMTADCLPVLFAAFDQEGQAVGVAAAHAGWRGLLDGVLQATAKALADQCAVPARQIRAWMGPAIGPLSFEVGADVRDAFTLRNPNNQQCFKPGAGAGKYLADIYMLAAQALAEQNIRNLEGGGLDTFTDSSWFSHRRGQQLGIPSGRFATLIRLLPSQAV
jgi:YfiH family protein